MCVCVLFLKKNISYLTKYNKVFFFQVYFKNIKIVVKKIIKYIV